MSAKEARQLNRILYLSVRVTGAKQQFEEVQRLMQYIEAARRAVVTYKLIRAAVSMNPLDVALAAVASISFATDLGGAL